jgi:dihydroorotate dehydrogenase subfamily 1
MSIDLRTKVGQIELATPLMLASGYITETPEFFLKAHPHGCSGMITRSLKEVVPPERARIPAPRYVVVGRDSMLNNEWGNERPWREWADSGVMAVQATGAPVIISLSGRDIQSCCNLISVFTKAGADAFEINISCSHSGALHGNLNTDAKHLGDLMAAVRPLTQLPIWIKLSYSTQLIAMALQAESLGADAIVCTNSIGPGMLIDIQSGRPKLGIIGGGGGLTGPAIFPIALWCVSELTQRLRIPVVGCGGVSNSDQAIQMLMAGASALQLYTAPALKGPMVFETINRGIRMFLQDHPRYNSVEELIGTVQRNSEHQFTANRPKIVANKCTGCAICVESCAFNAIDMIPRSHDDDLAVINDRCVSCNACVGVCPPRFGAITVSY